MKLLYFTPKAGAVSTGRFDKVQIERGTWNDEHTSGPGWRVTVPNVGKAIFTDEAASSLIETMEQLRRGAL